MSRVKRLVITAICIALCVVLPIAFHALPNAGRVFSPMHIPAILCGLTCGPVAGLICGAAGPLLSSLITGMPMMPMVPTMMLELAAYGFLSGLLMRYVRTKKVMADLYICLVGAMLGGRIISGLAALLFFQAGSYTMAAWTASYFINSFPAIILQLAIIPSIVFALEKAGLIQKRYSKNEKSVVNG